MVSNECSNVKHKRNITSVDGRIQTIMLAAQLTTTTKKEYVEEGPNSSHFGVLQAEWRLSH